MPFHRASSWAPGTLTFLSWKSSCFCLSRSRSFVLPLVHDDYPLLWHSYSSNNHVCTISGIVSLELKSNIPMGTSNNVILGLCDAVSQPSAWANMCSNLCPAHLNSTQQWSNTRITCQLNNDQTLGLLCLKGHVRARDWTLIHHHLTRSEWILV